jgi:hypothetical protein
MKFLLRIFKVLMFRSSFADRVRELELWQQIMVLWGLDINYMRKSWTKFLGNLQLMECNELPLVRMGSRADGGYLLANDFVNTRIVISLGVGKNVDAEMEFAKLGIKVLLFDGTISRLPRKHKNFEFYALNVYGNEADATDSFKSITINDLLEETLEGQKRFDPNDKHGGNALIMIDIEGSEYEVLKSVKPSFMMCFQQITIEFHDIHRELLRHDKRIHYVLNKLRKTHHLVDIHGNNFGGFVTIGNQDFPDVLETTWINKNLGTFRKAQNSLSDSTSMPNNPRRRELKLEW